MFELDPVRAEPSKITCILLVILFYGYEQLAYNSPLNKKNYMYV